MIALFPKKLELKNWLAGLVPRVSSPLPKRCKNMPPLLHQPQETPHPKLKIKKNLK